MVQAEGVFALYKGILPPILVETPKRAVKFLTFEQLKPLFMFGSDKPTPLVSDNIDNVIKAITTFVSADIFSCRLRRRRFGSDFGESLRDGESHASGES